MNTQNSTQENDKSAPVSAPYPGMPRWVKLLLIIALILAVLLVIALATGLGGPHGPGRHFPSTGSTIEPILAASMTQALAWVATTG
jgi:hypothetical protein